MKTETTRPSYLKATEEQEKQLVRKQKTPIIMKTRISQLVAVAIFTFIFLAGNVSAEGTELKASSHENIEEATLEMENWMVNEANWSTSDSFYFGQEIETGLELENWMINENNWEASAIYFETEFEQELSVENWMTNENNWKQNNIVGYVTETETELAIEPWMINELVWNK